MREHFHPVKSKLSFSALVTSIALIAMGSCCLPGWIPHVGVYGSAFLAVGILIGGVSAYYQFNRCKTAPQRRAAAVQSQGLLNRLGPGVIPFYDEDIFSRHGPLSSHEIQGLEELAREAAARGQRQATASPLENLIPDIFSYLTSFLDPQDLVSLAMCNSSLNRRVSQQLWKEVAFKAHIPLREMHTILARHGSEIQTLDMRRNLYYLMTDEIQQLIETVAHFCPNLTSFSYAHCGIGHPLDDFTAFSSLVSLTHLSCQHSLVSQPITLSTLKTLDLTKCGINVPQDFSSSLPPTLTSLNLNSLDFFFYPSNLIEDLFLSFSRLTSLESLNLSGNQIGDSFLERTTTSLSQLSSLHYLDLSKNDFHPASHLGDAIGSLPLTHLDLGETQLGDDGIRYLVENLSHLTSLKYLSLKGNLISAEGIRLLAPILPRLPLTHLDLSGNFLGAAGTQYLVNVLSQLEDLVYLNLSRNDLTAEGMRHLKGEITGLQKLRHLHMGGNILRLEGIQDLAEALPRSLTHLDLYVNDIGGAGIVHLATALSRLSSLQYLNLGAIHGGHFPSHGIEALNEPLSRLTSLVELDLSRNEDSYLWLSSLSPLKSLRKLNLRNTYFDMAQGRVFAEVLGHLTSLKELDLSSMHTSDENVRECIIAALAGLTSLKKLTLNPLTSRSLECLSRILPNLKALQSLHLFLNNRISSHSLNMLVNSLAELPDFTDLDAHTEQLLQREALRIYEYI